MCVLEVIAKSTKWTIKLGALLFVISFGIKLLDSIYEGYNKKYKAVAYEWVNGTVVEKAVEYDEKNTYYKYVLRPDNQKIKQQIITVDGLDKYAGIEKGQRRAVKCHKDDLYPNWNDSAATSLKIKKESAFAMIVIWIISWMVFIVAKMVKWSTC